MTKGHTVAAGARGAAATPLTGLRRGAFLAYRWALLAFLLAGVAQIFLAGLGVFSVQDHGVNGDTAFAPPCDIQHEARLDRVRAIQIAGCLGVFRLRHHNYGKTRYVDHGNDGTSFAWNDTAQLDYSKAEVR